MNIKSKIKVLHIFTILPVGGAETLMLNIAKNIDRDRFDLTVCCLSEKGDIGRQIEECGIEVISLGNKKIGSLNIPLLLKLTNLIKHKGFHIVHTHMYNAGFYGRLAARLANTPVILFSVHNIYQKTKPHRMFINRLLSIITDRVFVATSTVMADVMQYDRVPLEKMEIIPYGIDTDPFAETHDRNAVRKELGLKTEDIVIGNVARLEPAKGQSFLIEAVKVLKDRDINMKCLIIGSGRLEQELKGLADSLEINDRIIFLGTRTDLPRLFSAMDIFVFPSLWEGLPLSLLSAMASGLPIITTHAGGVKDVIVNGENGIVIPTSNPSAAAEAIKKMICDQRLRQRLSDRAKRDVMQNYSAMVMTKRLEKAYETIFSPHGTASLR